MEAVPHPWPDLELHAAAEPSQLAREALRVRQQKLGRTYLDQTRWEQPGWLPPRFRLPSGLLLEKQRGGVGRARKPVCLVDAKPRAYSGE